MERGAGLRMCFLVDGKDAMARESGIYDDDD